MDGASVRPWEAYHIEISVRDQAVMQSVASLVWDKGDYSCHRQTDEAHSLPTDISFVAAFEGVN